MNAERQEAGGAARFSSWAPGGRLLAVGGDGIPARRRDVTEDTAATTAVPGQRDPGPQDAGPGSADRETTQDHVTVCMPAEGAYLSVLRTATAGLAARLDFTLDEIEDLRIAVDEACAMLLAQAIPGTNLECAFDLGADEMAITVSVTAAEPRIPGRDGRLAARGRRRSFHSPAQAPGDTARAAFRVEVRVSGEFEVQVTEELEGVQAASEAVRVAHGSPDRARAREMFERLAVLPADDPERARIRGYLVELHLPLVEYLARGVRNRGEWLDDLTQVATIGLIKSIDRFDLDRGVEFSTYATPTIVGEIKRHFRDKGWAVRVPRRLQELKLSLTKAIGELAQREGRAPTVSELAAHLQMSEEDVLEGLESGNAHPPPPCVARPPRLGRRGRPRRVRLARHGRRRARGRGVPGVAQAAAGAAAAAGEEDPVAPVLRQHDPVADRGRARHLPDARVPAAGPHAGPAPGRADHRRLNYCRVGEGRLRARRLAGVNTPPRQ